MNIFAYSNSSTSIFTSQPLPAHTFSVSAEVLRKYKDKSRVGREDVEEEEEKEAAVGRDGLGGARNVLANLCPDTSYVLAIRCEYKSKKSADLMPVKFSTPPPPLFALSPHSTGPNLKLSVGPPLAPLKLTNTENKRWSAARASHPFSSGCHHWTVRIDKCVSKNIFIGICTSDSALGNYVGSDMFSWGYLANRAIWHNKSKVKAYGEQFKEGDVVGAKLDLRPGMGGSLSFFRNGRNLGVAVDGLEGR